MNKLRWVMKMLHISDQIKNSSLMKKKEQSSWCLHYYVLLLKQYLQEYQQDRGTEMMVSILNTLQWSHPAKRQSTWLLARTFLLPLGREREGTETEEERQQQPQQVSERDRSYREKKREGLDWEKSQSFGALWGVRHEDTAWLGVAWEGGCYTSEGGGGCLH